MLQTAKKTLKRRTSAHLPYYLPFQNNLKCQYPTCSFPLAVFILFSSLFTLALRHLSTDTLLGEAGHVKY